MDHTTVCKNCKFFLMDDGEPLGGECRKHAPQMLSGSGTGWSDKLFPFVKPDWWCGEFEEVEYIMAIQDDTI
jgi:hypothetical protein